MNPWRHVFKSVQAELDRRSQEVRGHRVLPNAIDVALPSAEFESFRPVLERATAELGETLSTWVQSGSRAWYEDCGPFLTVHLDPCRDLEIACDFRKG